MDKTTLDDDLEDLELGTGTEVEGRDQGQEGQADAGHPDEVPETHDRIVGQGEAHASGPARDQGRS